MQLVTFIGKQDNLQYLLNVLVNKCNNNLAVFKGLTRCRTWDFSSCQHSSHVGSVGCFSTLGRVAPKFFSVLSSLYAYFLLLLRDMCLDYIIPIFLCEHEHIFYTDVNRFGIISVLHSSGGNGIFYFSLDLFHTWFGKLRLRYRWYIDDTQSQYSVFANVYHDL